MEELKLRNNLNLDGINFGVEIEFDEVNLDIVKKSIEESFNYKLDEDFNYDHWIVSTDNSVTRGTVLGMIGGEAVSPILSDKYECYEEIEDVCNIIKALGGEPSDLTASHIHIDGKIMENNPKYLSNLIKLWIAYEDIIYKFGYNGPSPRRAIGAYASPFYTYMCYINQIEHSNSIMDILDLVGKDRNYSINLKNLKNAYEKNSKKINTIEIRCPNGTLDPVVWQNDINFYTKLILYAKNKNYDDKIIEKALAGLQLPRFYKDGPTQFSTVNLEKANELSNLIFEDEIDKVYFLRQYKR